MADLSPPVIADNESDGWQQDQAELEAWHGAQTYQELIQINLEFLLGKRLETIYHGGPIEEETFPMIPALLSLNSLGYLTIDSQPAEAGNCEGHFAGCTFTQRFYLNGIFPKRLISKLDALKANYFLTIRSLDLHRPYLYLSVPPGAVLDEAIIKQDRAQNEQDVVEEIVEKRSVIRLGEVFQKDLTPHPEHSQMESITADNGSIIFIEELRPLVQADIEKNYVNVTIISRDHTQGSIEEVLAAVQ